MPLTDDFDRGARNRRAALGDAWVDRSLDNATSFNADFQSLITRYAWNDVWGRPGLDFTTRRLLVLAQTAALSRWEEFELHFRAAVRGGVSVDALKETLMQVAVYSGVPAANTAFKIATEVLRDEGHPPEPRPLSAAVREVEQYTLSSPQLHVTVQGTQGRLPVVLSHALGVDMHMWDALAEVLARKHRVLRYDHRGHGRSGTTPGPWTMDQHLVEDAARVVREWGQGPVVWVGLSMGGMVGQGLALNHPDLVRGLVLANTTSRYPAENRPAWNARIEAVQSQGLPGILQGVLERYYTADFRAANPGVVQATTRTLLADDAASYVAACHAVRDVDYTDRLKDIQVPTLVIAGDQDMGTPVAMSQLIAERVKGADLQVIADASHLSAVEQPEKFAALVSAFLDRVA